MRQLHARLLIAALFLFSAGCATVQPPVVAPQPPPETSYYQISTRLGDMVVRLYDETPQHRDNFRRLVAQDFYDGTTFHRVIEGFMVQGGDPTGTGTGCLDAGCEERLPGYQFEDELAAAEALPESDAPGTVVYPRGVIAMANSGPNTQGSQFFIMHQDSPLPPAYSVFGEVVEGLEVVDDIVQGPAAGDQALDPVIVRSVDIEEA
jgi:cyclophilin family peptidyl-prolyl cis-trans isomerase